ncbi:hypothetical protein JTB14_036751 [Gonioctena quinquepunctata]|nr:hypothetical protein JTB14_036751 [Gonioctena quinquepunctata]
MFTHVYIGNCGSVPDQRKLRLSEVSDYLNNPVTYFPEDCHLIGDSAYTILKHLLVPFRNDGHLTEQQLYFNTSLSSVRGNIERAFGLLKNRFRRILNCCPLTDIEFIPKYVLACCVLHNICLMRNDLIDVELLDVDNVQVDVRNRHYNDFWVMAGRNKRERITRNIWPGEL